MSAASPTPTPRVSKRGTPISPAWDDYHVELLETVEEQYNRRVCGARTINGFMCTLESTHENGRCRFHGGFNLTGAQPAAAGNRNGVIHGLYSRAIQTCGDHCPVWKSCPCAGPDVMKLNPPQRPKCPFETAQYNASLTDALARLDTDSRNDALKRHTAHHVAMLQVMVMRAAGAMAENPLSDTLQITSGNYRMTDRKPSVYMNAFLRLSSELRRYMAQLEVEHSQTLKTVVRHEQIRRAEHDTSLLPEDQTAIHTPRPPSAAAAFDALDNASYQLRHDKEKARKFFDEAMALDAEYVSQMLDSTSAYYVESFAKLAPFAHAP